jgi:hypothetical protein
MASNDWMIVNNEFGMTETEKAAAKRKVVVTGWTTKNRETVAVVQVPAEIRTY